MVASPSVSARARAAMAAQPGGAGAQMQQVLVARQTSYVPSLVAVLMVFGCTFAAVVMSMRTSKQEAMAAASHPHHHGKS